MKTVACSMLNNSGKPPIEHLAAFMTAGQLIR
jgi:hypothetical protein